MIRGNLFTNRVFLLDVKLELDASRGCGRDAELKGKSQLSKSEYYKRHIFRKTYAIQ